MSSIDFDLAYNEYRSTLNTPAGPGADQVGRELQVRMSSGLNNDKITISFGSQFGSSPGISRNNNFLGEDAMVEFILTENRRWRLKIYQRTEPDVTGGTLRQRYGLGLAFHRDYDSFSEMIQIVGNWFRGGKQGNKKS